MPYNKLKIKHQIPTIGYHADSKKSSRKCFIIQYNLNEWTWINMEPWTLPLDKARSLEVSPGSCRIVTTLKWQFLSSCQTQKQPQFNASDSRPLYYPDADDVGLLLPRSLLTLLMIMTWWVRGGWSGVSGICVSVMSNYSPYPSHNKLQPQPPVWLASEADIPRDQSEWGQDTEGNKIRFRLLISSDIGMLDESYRRNFPT